MTDKITILEAQITNDWADLRKDVEAGLYPADRLNAYYEAVIKIKDKMIEYWMLVAGEWNEMLNQAIKNNGDSLTELRKIQGLVDKDSDKGSENNPLGGTAEGVDIEREKEMCQ